MIRRKLMPRQKEKRDFILTAAIIFHTVFWAVVAGFAWGYGFGCAAGVW